MEQKRIFRFTQDDGPGDDVSNLELSRAQRLDQRVVELVPELSRGYAARLIADGKVTVNGEAQTRAGYKLREGDKVGVDFDASELERIPDIELPVLYEDDNCVVIVKPVGLLSHSKGAFNPEATVATWLRRHIERQRVPGEGKEQPEQNPHILSDAMRETIGLSPFRGERGGIVHRLDRATSGVMICAKNPESLSWLQKQFATRNVKKTYAAVVKGELNPPEAVIDMPIERNPKAPATFRVGMQGKSAVTQYRTVQANRQYSLVELRPTTGRTHQLRVHLSQLGHPIVGDPLYGGEPADRLYLHAETLEITLPKSHERKVFRAPVPPEFNARVAL